MEVALQRKKLKLLPVFYRIGLISKEDQQIKEMASKKIKKKDCRNLNAWHLPIRARLGKEIQKKKHKKGTSPKVVVHHHHRRSPKHLQDDKKIRNNHEKNEHKENTIAAETLVTFTYNDFTRLINEKINHDLKKLKIEQQNDFPESDFLNIVVNFPKIIKFPKFPKFIKIPKI